MDNIRIFKDELNELSDIQYQKELWAGKIPGQSSSYVELMCRLYDDKRIKEYSECIDEKVCPAEIRLKLVELVQALDSFEGDDLEINQFESSLDWLRITKIATDILELISGIK